MYAANYGFPNGAPPSQNPQMPGQGPNPNQQPQQQQMMYNPQQFPMAAQGGAFPGNPNVNMMPGAGPAGGMMQNAGMPHMAAANGQSKLEISPTHPLRVACRNRAASYFPPWSPSAALPNYQAPYSNNPYGAGVPTSVAPQMNMPQNYAMGGGMPMGGFQMHPGQMTPQQQQQMMQRMQPPQSNPGGMSSNTPQRQFPGQGQTPGPQSTPTPTNSLPSQQPQFSTPQANHTPVQSHTPNNTLHQPQQSLGSSIQTPQTPTFPSNVQGATTNGTANAIPLSPSADSRDKERIAVILEINSELLWEATQVQNTMLAVKNEKPPSKDGPLNDSEKTDEEKLLMQDFSQCMRRLQGNLAYLAQLADKKTSGQAAAHPSYMKPPPLSTKVKIRPTPPPEGSEGKAVEPASREETIKYFHDLYTKLQNLYPGVDYNKEPALPPPGARPGPQGPGVQKVVSSVSNLASPVPGKQPTPKLATSGPPQLAAAHPTPNGPPA
ncbi:putative Glutamine repeat protein-1 [Seiridium cardinale]